MARAAMLRSHERDPETFVESLPLAGVSMDRDKIARSVSRLEQNLPIRRSQTRLPPPLRSAHQRILRFFFERGRAPALAELEAGVRAAVARLAAEHIVVVDGGGEITGAYPFVDEDRGFRVVSRFGAANAMCAFDALAVSSMFGEAVVIESRCRVGGRAIVIEQRGADIRLLEPADEVFAAIDWDAAAGAGCCSTSLCREMVFIAGENNARAWQARSAATRELFRLGEAHAFIGSVFVPLMRDVPAARGCAAGDRVSSIVAAR